MHYQSLIKKLCIVMKPGRKKLNEAGESFEVPAERIRFHEYMYKPQNPEEEKFLDDYLAKPGKKHYWKVTDEELKLASEYAKDLKALNAKYKEKKKELEKVIGKKGTAGTKAQLVAGLSSTELKSSDIDPDLELEKTDKNWRDELVKKAKEEANKEYQEKMNGMKDELQAAKDELADTKEKLASLTVEEPDEEPQEELQEVPQEETPAEEESK